MTIATAYTAWATSYDTDRNLTRDLDADITRKRMGTALLHTVVEAGCGTGKNTRYFALLAQQVHALDFSEGMLAVAKRHVVAAHVQFHLADLSLDWPCPPRCADVVSFNLVLEHLQDLRPVLRQAARVVRPGGQVYISELHPFKQYQNSQARFLNAQGAEVKIAAFRHHVSDYLDAAKACGLQLVHLGECWHAEDPSDAVPRLLTLQLHSTATAGAGA
jgi:ubiquinone/menaquinone biosynthesis C-methylase UbiE